MWNPFKKPPTPQPTVPELPASFRVIAGEKVYEVAEPTPERLYHICAVLGVNDFGEALIKENLTRIFGTGDGDPASVPPLTLQHKLMSLYTERVQDYAALLQRLFKGANAETLTVNAIKPADVEGAVLYFFLMHRDASIASFTSSLALIERQPR